MGFESRYLIYSQYLLTYPCMQISFAKLKGWMSYTNQPADGRWIHPGSRCDVGTHCPPCKVGSFLTLHLTFQNKAGGGTLSTYLQYPCTQPWYRLSF